MSECLVEETCEQDRLYCTCCIRSKTADYRLNDYYEPSEQEAFP
jgi:hypothetical protein